MIVPIKSLAPAQGVGLITWVLILANIAVFLAVSGDQRAYFDQVFNFGMQPDRLEDMSSWVTLVTYGFVHAGWLHLGFNMLTLFAFGRPVESRLGPVVYGLMWMIALVAAALAHVAVTKTMDVPLVGASGAVAAVMGLHLVLYPHARVWSLLVVIPLQLPSVLIMAQWVLAQFGGLGHTAEVSNVAYGAHLGGFAIGAVWGLIVKRMPERKRQPISRARLDQTLTYGQESKDHSLWR